VSESVEITGFEPILDQTLETLRPPRSDRSPAGARHPRPGRHRAVTATVVFLQCGSRSCCDRLENDRSRHGLGGDLVWDGEHRLGSVGSWAASGVSKVWSKMARSR